MTHHPAVRLTLATVVAFGCYGSATVSADTSVGSLTVTANVVKVCMISSGTLAFGAYNPSAATALDSSASLTLTCTPGTSYDIGMAAGGGTGATTTLRKLTNGGSTLSYRLFKDADRTENWGNTPGTDALAGVSSAVSLTNTINIYGRIPANEAVPFGNYADAVVVTVTY